MRLRLRLALPMAMICSSAVLAQPVESQSELVDEQVIVSGKRRDGPTLTVDFQRVARQCAECKRVLAEIGKLAEPYQVKKGQIIRDRKTMVESIAEHTRGGDPIQQIKNPDGADFLNPYAGRPPEMSQSGRLAAQVPHHLRKDQVELGTIRRDVSGLVASFLAQLDPYVVEAAEAERAARRAAKVIKANRRATTEKRIDVTAAIIRRLDAMPITIVLPTSEAAAP